MLKGPTTARSWPPSGHAPASLPDCASVHAESSYNKSASGIQHLPCSIQLDDSCMCTSITAGMQRVRPDAWSGCARQDSRRGDTSCCCLVRHQPSSAGNLFKYGGLPSLQHHSIALCPASWPISEGSRRASSLSKRIGLQAEDRQVSGRQVVCSWETVGVGAVLWGPEFGCEVIGRPKQHSMLVNVYPAHLWHVLPSPPVGFPPPRLLQRVQRCRQTYGGMNGTDVDRLP